VTDRLAAPYCARIAAVRSVLSERGIDCLLVSSRVNVRYLTGFAGSSGWVLLSQSAGILATDSRYIEQVRSDLGDNFARLADGGLNASAAAYIGELGFAALAFEAEHLSYAGVNALEAALRAAGARCQLRATEGIVEGLRVRKDDGEIDAIRQAAALTDGAIAHARATIRSGMTERELAWNLERWMRENGSGPIAFSIIVASGPNAALPHAVPGDRPFAPGEPIVIDIGATCNGYCSDLTRTLFVQRMDHPFDSVYQTVLSAHMAALHGARNDMEPSVVDEKARMVIRDAGLAEYFTHGLGHGVGLEIHERPTVSTRSTERLTDRMVFTIEPGVYLPGQGGVRIEDTVVMLDGTPRSFSHSNKTDPII
jgi:Xaa-Pro aminopeptidase